ncbi:MAG: UvrD-helicase domain-containing protein [Armatimonas sp.]
MRGIVRAHKLSLIADPRLPDAVLGKYDPTRKKIKVHGRLQAADAEPEFAFVVGHELGHHCLRHDADIVLIDDKDTLDQEPNINDLGARPVDNVYRVYSERERQELEANLFAAELLAPSEAIVRAVADASTWSVDSLATHFGLRPFALESRLSAVLLGGALDRSTSVEQTVAEIAKIDELPKVTPLEAAIGTRHPRQRDAASSRPALVLAGPGSGKTTVLVDRYVGLIERGEAKASEILALTFTNKAAAEMSERIVAQLRLRGLLTIEDDPKNGTAANGMREPANIRLADVQVTTLHAFALDLITRYSVERNASPPNLLTTNDALLLLAFWREQLPMGAFENLSDVYGALAEVLNAVGILQDRDCSPLSLLRLARRECFPDGMRWDPNSRTDRWREDEKMRRYRSLALIYRSYQKFCHQNNHLDFTGILRKATELIERDGIPNTLSQHWRYVLVDEYQDMNRPCARLLNALVAGRPNSIWAVGDPRQSIYRFRGATPEDNLITFRQDYSQALPTALTVNYRSVPDIVAFGNEVGQKIALPEAIRSDAQLQTALAESGAQADRDASEVSGPSVVYGVLEHEADELEFITESVEQLSRKCGVALNDIAVLCRTKRQATSVALALEEAGFSTTWSGALEDEEGFRELICALLFSIGDTVGLEGLAQRYGLSAADLAVIRELSHVRVEDDHRLTGPLPALHIALAGGAATPNGPVLSEAARDPASALLRLGEGLSRSAYNSGAGSVGARRGALRILAAYLFIYSQDARELLSRRARMLLSDHDTQKSSSVSDNQTTITAREARRVIAWAQTFALARSFPERASASVLTTHRDGKPRHPASAFLDYIQVCQRHSRLEVPDEMPSEKPAVHVLTIHRSKGLEWPVVFVPNLTRKRFCARKVIRVKLPSVLEPDEHREEQCIFYVAITRARDRLILTRARYYGASKNAHNPASFLESVVDSLPIPVESVPSFGYGSKQP